MRTLRLVMVALLAAAPALAPAAPEEAAEGEANAAACVEACDTAREACLAEADAAAEKCRKDAFAPCETWCGCDRYIGAAYFQCQLECEKCEGEAERIAARCPAASGAKAACDADYRRCRRECAAGE